MDRQHTQFWVAVIGMCAMAIITGMAVAGTIWGDAPNEMAFLLVGGLVSVTSTAAAWLFRLNGTKK